MSKDLIQALEAWMDIHDNPAGYVGKYGKALDAAIAAQQNKIDAAANKSRAALSRHRSSFESVEMDARRYRLLRDFDSADTELAICRWSEHGWCGEWVIEHDPDTEIDKALAKREAQ